MARLTWEDAETTWGFVQNHGLGRTGEVWQRAIWEVFQLKTSRQHQFRPFAIQIRRD
jgi:hypothetical protein